jgi:hypothetical protein
LSSEPIKHSVKALPSVTLDKKSLSKLYIGKGFVKYFLSDTRQRKVTVTALGDGDEDYVSATVTLGKAHSLPSELVIQLF